MLERDEEGVQATHRRRSFDYTPLKSSSSSRSASLSDPLDEDDESALSDSEGKRRSFIAQRF